MTLYKPTFESVRYVAQNMRQVDRDEIYPLLFDPSPDELARRVMSDTTYCWLAAKNAPIAAFGMFEVKPRAWTAFAFGTDDFPKVAKEVTKFLIQKVRPHLFLELGAQRIEAHSSKNHVTAHKWLTRLGAKATEDPEYGPNGETYLHFIMRRSDFNVTRQAKSSRIVVSGRDATGGQPDLARPDGTQAPPEHVHPFNS